MANPGITFPMTPLQEQTNYPRHSFYKDVAEEWTLALDVTPAIPSGAVPLSITATAFNRTLQQPAPSVIGPAAPPVSGFLAAIVVKAGTINHVYALTLVVTCSGTPAIVLGETILMVIAP